MASSSFHKHGALLIAVGKVMVINQVSALVANHVKYDEKLIEYMMQEGLTYEEAKEELEVELSEAVNSQI